MNKILVEVSVGELLDKISILEIKQEKIKDAESLKFITDEYNVLKAELDKNIKTDEKLKNLFNSLKEINSKLWVIEDDKRMCEKNKDFGEKFIKLSRDIHFLNDNRAKIKLEINKEYAILKQSQNLNIKLTNELKDLFDELKKVNLNLWDIEDKLRICEKNKDYGKNFIELARNVYFNNDKRSIIKLEINKILGSNIKEIKQYVSY